MEEKKEEIDIREIAEAHWKYAEGIINLVSALLLHNEEEDIEISKQAKDLMHYLYVEGWVHGAGHGIEIERNRKYLK